jgi:hypothetical protein
VARSGWLALLIAISGTACGFSGPQPSQGPPVRSFSYELAPIASALPVGESLHFVWEPHQDPNFAAATADMTLCFGLFGPWPDVGTLKSEIQAQRDGGTVTCPLSRAAVTSDALHTTSAAGERLTAEALGPSQPGFYDLREVNIARAGAHGSTVVLHRIVEVPAR